MTKKASPAAPPADKPGAAQGQEQHIEVASVVGASAKDVKALLAQIADLKKQLKLSEEQRTEAEKAALAAAEAQGLLMQRDIQEVATGKKVKVKRCSGYKVVAYKEDGREIKRPLWKTIELSTYFYKVDIPPCGGMDLKVNDVPLYHGMVYELDIDTLRTVKDMVFRLWDHDRNIHGSDENVYRQQQSPNLTARR